LALSVKLNSAKLDFFFLSLRKEGQNGRISRNLIFRMSNFQTKFYPFFSEISQIGPKSKFRKNFFPSGTWLNCITLNGLCKFLCDFQQEQSLVFMNSKVSRGMPRSSRIWLDQHFLGLSLSFLQILLIDFLTKLLINSSLLEPI